MVLKANLHLTPTPITRFNTVMKVNFLLPKLQSFDDVLDFLPTVLLSLGVVITPLILLPFGENIFKHSKNLSFFAVLILVLAVFALQIFRKKVFRLLLSPFFLPLVLFLFASLASSLFTGSSYPVEALIGWGGVYLSFALLTLIASSILNKNAREVFPLSLSVLGVVLSVMTVMEYAGTGPSQLISQLLGIPIATNTAFSLSGSVFIAAQLLVLAFISSIFKLKDKSSFKLWYLFSLPIIAIGAAVAIYLSLPGKPTAVRLAPFQVSWQVATSTLNVPRSALIGFGPESYMQVYTQLKPASINTRDIWNAQFVQGSNTPLTIMTTMGVLGFLAWSLLFYQVAKQIKSSQGASRGLIFTALVAFILQLLFPANVPVLVVLAAALSFWAASEQSRFSSIELHPLQVSIARAGEKEEKISEYSKAFGMVAATGIGLVLLIVGFGLFRVYASYSYAFMAERQAVKGDAVGVYNNQRQAIAYNPYIDSLRRQYAITNLQIATAISTQENPSQEDNQQVTQLIQQAIREARAATLINDRDSQNWRTLATIYRNLIGVAEGAENWTVSSYSRAIELAPSDPTLRIDLGGVFYAQEEYQQAATLFEQAALLKPDYANAYYNLANALKEAGTLEQAAQYYQQTLALLDPSSTDYQTAAQELQGLQAKLQTQTSEGEAGAAQEESVNLIEESLPADQPSQPGVESEAQTELSPGVQDVLDGGEETESAQESEVQ